jgi:ApaG protein
MVGHYIMQNQDGETFDVDVPAFSLDSPYDTHSVN